MKKLMILMVLLFAATLASQPVLAQTGSVGCGAGSGSTLASTCGGVISTTNGITQTNVALDGTLTSVNGVPSSLLSGNPELAEELTPNNELWFFNFLANDSTGNGTFGLFDTDGSTASPSDFQLMGTISGFMAMPNGSGGKTYTFNLSPTSVSLGADGIGLLQTFAVSGYTGQVTIVDPPSSITSFSATFGIPLQPGPNPNGVTLEPGSLSLLATGLLGLGAAIRRRLV